MIRPSDGEWLALWDRAARLPPSRRALSLLSATGEDAGRLSVGEGDRRLFLLRRELFGDRVEALTECPRCEARVEIDFRIGDLGVDDPAEIPPEAVVVGEYAVRWRLPTWGDLAALEGDPPPAGRERLRDLCLDEVRRGGRPVPVHECPPDVVAHVGDAMVACDPFADVRFETTCPECGAAWRPRFDIGRYLWRELDAWARRLLRDVHALASTYGWNEREILALAPARRRAYLELVGA